MSEKMLEIMTPIRFVSAAVYYFPSRLLGGCRSLLVNGICDWNHTAINCRLICTRIWYRQTKPNYPREKTWSHEKDRSRAVSIVCKRCGTLHMTRTLIYQLVGSHVTCYRLFRSSSTYVNISFNPAYEWRKEFRTANILSRIVPRLS